MARRKSRRRRSHARHRRRVVRANPVRHRRRHRRSYRANPGLGRGLIGKGFQGIKCGIAILAGEGLSTTAAGYIPVLANVGIVGGLKIGLVGTLLGTFGSRFLRGYEREFIGAAWAKAIKVAVPQVHSIPLIGSGLAGYTPLIAASRMSGYAPRAVSSGMSASDDGSGYSF